MQWKQISFILKTELSFFLDDWLKVSIEWLKSLLDFVLEQERMLNYVSLRQKKKITNSKFCLPKVEMKEQLEVTDLKGNKIGVMNVSISLKQ
jgi:hypothetical protein